MVYTGARKYSKDPTVVQCLARPIIDLAQESLLDPNHVISTIEATLLLCLWPLPINSTSKDRRNAFAGAAMQLAVQNGLHVFSREQDFARTELNCSDDSSMFRARL